MKLTARLKQEPPWYVAQCLEVDVASQGKTPETAMANLREALELYFETSSPQPSEPTSDTTFELSLPAYA